MLWISSGGARRRFRKFWRLTSCSIPPCPRPGRGPSAWQIRACLLEIASDFQQSERSSTTHDDRAPIAHSV